MHRIDVRYAEWASIIAKRLGYPAATALALGRAVAGYSAQAKAGWLGLVEERAEEAEAPARERAPRPTIQLLGRQIPVIAAPDGSMRAEEHGKPASAQSVLQYIRRAFGDRLAVVRARTMPKRSASERGVRSEAAKS
jgi:hypothetical protein